MAADPKKKICQTVIPKDWPQITTPEYTRHMTVAQANSAWKKWVRDLNKLGPTPKIYR